jgi:hypothetical protein
MALKYLLSPEFQISVTSGKPNTGGWIEVFIHGSRTKYFTACDWNGTKNPFRIPLDSLGQALILADDSNKYDVFVYNRYGSLLFSRYNVMTSGGGSGDSTEALEWFRGESYSVYEESDIYVPVKVGGTMDVLEDGIQVYGNRYYHITAHLSAVRETTAPYYDSFDVRIVGHSENPQTVLEQHFTIDWSMGLVQDFEISADFMCRESGTIRFYVDGVGEYGEVQLKDVEVHRVYSGVADVPGHLLTREEADGLYQGTLTAGYGISINQDNVISVARDLGTQSDWAENSPGSPAFIRNKPDLSVYATQEQVSALTEQVTALSGTVTQLSSAVSTLQTQMLSCLDRLNSVTGQVNTNTSNLGNLNTRYNQHGNNYDADSHRISHLL